MCMRSLSLVFLLPALLAVTACSEEMFRGTPHPYTGWQVSNAFTTPEGNRVCAVSSGEITVTQWSFGQAIAEQVSISPDLHPDTQYKMIIYGNIHTPQPDRRFTLAESQAILHDFAQSYNAFGEWWEFTDANRKPILRHTNKTFLRDFPGAYQLCRHFVAGQG